MQSLALFTTLVVALVTLLALSSSVVDACTTVLVGKKASADGSVMITHSNDGNSFTDARLVKVPGRIWREGSSKGNMRPVYQTIGDFPRYVGTEKGVPEYFPVDGQTPFDPIAYIENSGTERVLADGSTYTYGYLEESYGVLNEVGLGIGESTCSAVYSAKGTEVGGKALFTIDELTRIAMERASTARHACQLMGDLAVKYGFHGEDESLQHAGESLMVADADEGFVFHVLPDATGSSAIWVAQRVEDDEVAVVANMFTIRDVDLSHTHDFLGRQDMWQLAKEGGLWEEGQPLDFTATFSYGEYNSRYYSGRRMWGAFRKLAPVFTEAHVPTEYESLRFDRPYPFAVKPEEPVTVETVLAIHRDWYQGTEFDLSAGMQGGFQGSPDRYKGCHGEDCKDLHGNWQRSIGLFRTSDTVLAQIRRRAPSSASASASASSLAEFLLQNRKEISPTLWYAPHAAHTSLFTPISPRVKATAAEHSRGFAGDSVSESRKNNGAYWASRMVSNVMQIRFQDMLPMLQERQQLWEQRGVTLQRQWEHSELHLLNTITLGGEEDRNLASLGAAYDEGMLRLTDIYHQFNRNAVKSWWSLSDELVFGFSDGAFNRVEEGKYKSDVIGYPSWWLQDPSVHWVDGPEAPENALTKHHRRSVLKSITLTAEDF